ncbi:MAG: beta-lactamase family protein, partial [Elusimicrobia bacterium]|nr:beta-lactamase family protein [Elusimicrobiota bacterium]
MKSEMARRIAAGLLFVIAAAFAGTVPAAATDTTAREGLFEKLDAWVAGGLSRSGDPGAALVVADRNGVVHCRGFGHDTHGAAITCGTRFPVASLTKGFTAIAVMRAVERGAVRLDAPIKTYLPSFRPADAFPITVRDALQMLTGFDTTEGQRWLASADASPGALARRVAALNRARLFARPGSTFAYSNADFDLLGAVLERVERKPYATIMRETVLEPLGLSGAAIGRDVRIRGYSRVFGVPVPALPPPRDAADDPAAGLLIEPHSLGRYVAAQLDEGRSWSAHVLSRGDWQRLHTSPIDSPYAMGLFDDVVRGRHVYWHDGLAPDFHAYVVLVPDR